MLAKIQKVHYYGDKSTKWQIEIETGIERSTHKITAKEAKSIIKLHELKGEKTELALNKFTITYK